MPIGPMKDIHDWPSGMYPAHWAKASFSLIGPEPLIGPEAPALPIGPRKAFP